MRLRDWPVLLASLLILAIAVLAARLGRTRG
jgi:hypothetical protein